MQILQPISAQAIPALAHGELTVKPSIALAYALGARAPTPDFRHPGDCYISGGGDQSGPSRPKVSAAYLIANPEIATLKTIDDFAEQIAELDPSDRSFAIFFDALITIYSKHTDGAIRNYTRVKIGSFMKASDFIIDSLGKNTTIPELIYEYLLQEIRKETSRDDEIITILVGILFAALSYQRSMEGLELRDMLYNREEPKMREEFMLIVMLVAADAKQCLTDLWRLNEDLIRMNLLYGDERTVNDAMHQLRVFEQYFDDSN